MYKLKAAASKEDLLESKSSFIALVEAMQVRNGKYERMFKSCTCVSVGVCMPMCVIKIQGCIIACHEPRS